MSFANPEDENDGGLAEWKWKDGDENKICYSWEGGPECDGYNEVKIFELTENQLTMVEDDKIYYQSLFQ